MKSVKKEHEINPFILGLAVSIVQKHRIDPHGRNLIGLIGTGYEKNNLEAVACWVKDSIQQMTDGSGSLICILNENFNDEFSSYSDAVNDDTYNLLASK